MESKAFAIGLPLGNLQPTITMMQRKLHRPLAKVVMDPGAKHVKRVER